MQTNTMRLKRPGFVVGVGALAVLGALTAGSHSGNAGVAANLAGSGDAPTNTVFVSPAVSANNNPTRKTALSLVLRGLADGDGIVPSFGSLWGS